MILRSCILANGLSLAQPMQFLIIRYTLTPKVCGVLSPAWTVPSKNWCRFRALFPVLGTCHRAVFSPLAAPEFMPGICDQPKPVPIIETEPDHFVACYLYDKE